MKKETNKISLKTHRVTKRKHYSNDDLTKAQGFSHYYFVPPCLLCPPDCDPEIHSQIASIGQRRQQEELKSRMHRCFPAKVFLPA